MALKLTKRRKVIIFDPPFFAKNSIFLNCRTASLDTGLWTKDGLWTLDIGHWTLKELIFFFVKRLYFHHNLILKQTASAIQEKMLQNKG